MAASTRSTSVTTRGTDTMISTMLFSSPALMVADTACSLVATVDRCVSRLLLVVVTSSGGAGRGEERVVRGQGGKAHQRGAAIVVSYVVHGLIS